MNSEKKKRNFPNVMVILFAMLIIATIATWAVPAGEYERELGPDDREVVVPDSFTYIERTPVGPFELFEAIPRGMTEAGMISFTIFIIGGAWAVVNATGAISVSLDKLGKKLKGREVWIIPIVMIIFASVGCFIGAVELSLVYVPVLIPLMLALRYDLVTAAATALVATVGSQAAALTNPFSIGIAQDIAGLPLYSGIEYRIVVLVTFIAVGILYVMRYANQVKKDPQKGLVYEETLELQKKLSEQQEIEPRSEHNIIIIILFAGLAAFIYGVLRLNWFMFEIGAIFAIIAVAAGIVGRLSANRIAEIFIEGAKGVALAALVVGLARGILIIIEDGNIIDTIIMGLVVFVGALPGYITSAGMLIAQSLFNFLVPSASGQTLITMPILAPLADVVGITRQTTVLATQLGDGITNIFYPVSGVLMACLAIARIPYERWIKFIFPLVLIWTGLGVVFLVIAQLIQWGPF